MKFTLLTIFLTLSISAFSQKEGKFLERDNPVNNLWESVDGEETGARILDSRQQFFFLIPEGSEGSMAAPFEMEDLGVACPSYFVVSLDEQFLYLDFYETCELGIPEEELFVKLKYSISTDGTRLTLTVDGEDSVYKEWSYE
jgi:hypothetical protein